MCKNSEIERNDEQPLLERLEAYGQHRCLSVSYAGA